jgi:hypothetical protein
MPTSASASCVEEYDSDDLVPLTREMRDHMLDVILAWARFDSALSALVTGAFQMPMDRGAILIENMDIGNKINRLKRLYKHLGNDKVVSTLGKIKKDYEDIKDIRNTIAHATCAGASKSMPGHIVFAPVRASIGLVNTTELNMLHIDQLKTATVIVLEWADMCINAYDALIARSSTLRKK